MPFPAFFMPMLIGAGTGALSGLLAGKDPLKGALIGGATGGLLGAAMPAASAVSGTAAAGKTTATAGSNALSGGAGGGFAAGANPAAFLAPTGQEIGMANAFNLASNAPTDLAMQTIGASNSMLSSPMMGGLNALSPADYSRIASTSAVPDSSSIFDGLGEYFNPRDMGNVAMQSLANQPRQQMPQAPAGGISRGQAMQGQDVMALLQTIRQPERRRISLV